MYLIFSEQLVEWIVLLSALLSTYLYFIRNCTNLHAQLPYVVRLSVSFDILSFPEQPTINIFLNTRLSVISVPLLRIHSMMFHHLAFIDVEGYDGLVRKYPAAVPNVTVPNTTCHLASEHAFTMLRDPADPDLPWPGFLLGQTPGSIWYWCTDQVSLLSW